MLEQLFGSKIRVKLLQIFLANPQKSYYLRQLTRMLNTQINSVRREVNNLLLLGILKEEERKEKSKKQSSFRRYFQADTNFLLYPELRSLILKSHLLIKQGLARDILKTGRIYYLALTGIFTNTNAPVDILIVGKVDKNKVKKIMEKFSENISREINYTILSKSEFNYRRDMTDRFLYEILENPKVVLVDELKA